MNCYFNKLCQARHLEAGDELTKTGKDEAGVSRKRWTCDDSKTVESGGKVQKQEESTGF